MSAHHDHSAFRVPNSALGEAPHPGSRQMPRWNLAELDEPPRVGWKQWAGMIGPGIVLAGSAIGSGEWLLGPAVSARYGGALLWLATLSLIFQLAYNLEASRYTLYTGEPIFTGKFRTLPGPAFWFLVYLALDFGSLMPYMIVHAATAAASVWLGRVPNPEQSAADTAFVQGLAFVLLIVAMIPLMVGGKVYNSVKALMSMKIVVVLGFLMLIAVLYSSLRTWTEIGIGFLRFGTVPMDATSGEVTNIFARLWRGEPMPSIDRSAIPLLTSFAAVAGIGGLAQTNISNYTRDQGWGMGRHVGAIPSLIGGLRIGLSHTGTVFLPTPLMLQRWRRWQRHVLRDQAAIWLPGSLIGMALPTMLSVEFLARGTTASQWQMAGMTADGIAARVGGALGWVFWYGVLVCGFLVLMPSIISNADGFIRRWLDAGWTSLRPLHRIAPRHIKRFYFGMLVTYFVIAVIFLSMQQPMALIVLYGNLGNFALGFSCFHTLFVNTKLLPEPIRPGRWRQVWLALAGVYFMSLAILTGVVAFGLL